MVRPSTRGAAWRPSMAEVLLVSSVGNTNPLDRVDGGRGIDAMAMDGSGLRFHLATVASPSARSTADASRLSSLEIVDPIGSGNNAPSLGCRDVADLAGFTGLNAANSASFAQSGGT